METVGARVRQAIERRERLGWERTEQATAAADLLVDDWAPVGRLADLAVRFGLGDVELDLLTVAVLAEHATAAHLVLGLLSGDDHPARPTVALALELAGAEPTGPAARRWLGALSPLIRFGLLELAGTDVLLTRRVIVADRVAEHLAGSDLPPAMLLPLFVEPVPIEVEGTALIRAALADEHRLVWVHTVTGGAGIAMASAACEALGVRSLVADLARLGPDAPVDAALRGLLLEAGLEGAVLVLAGAERARMDTLIGSPMPVLAVSVEPWNPLWSPQMPLTVAAPRPSARDRRLLWESILGPEHTTAEIVAMPLSPEQIVAAGAHARQMAVLEGDASITTDRIRSSVRQLGRGRSLRANPGGAARLDDLVLSGDAMTEVRRLLDWARSRDEVVALGSLYGKGGKGTGICALFTGPPGTGKTLAAHVVADSLGMDLYQVDLSSIVDKYIGETEKNLERVFTEAESMNAVLFFDEADALFGSRSEVKDSKDRYANQEVAYLLQRMEQFDGITVLASNLRGNIDPAFARRLHFIVSFLEPDVPTRKRLWEHHLAPLPTDPTDPIAVDDIAQAIDLAGGDVRNIVLSAAYAAVADGVPVGMRHISAAVTREYIKLGRRPPLVRGS